MFHLFMEKDFESKKKKKKKKKKERKKEKKIKRIKIMIYVENILKMEYIVAI